MTKLFAVFLLIPLALFYLYWRPKNLKHALAEIFLFFLPALLFYFLWYEVISGLGFFSPLTHNDFSTSIPNGTAMSPFFLLYFFNENPGLFLLLVCTISLGLSLWKRRLFTKTYAFDLICAATIVSVAGLNSYLALARNLWVPYVNPIKYDYLILPAFCCLAASLASKYNLLRREAVSQKWRNKLALLLATVGLALLVVAFIVNMIVLATVIGASRLTFKVDPIVGYSFDRLSPVAEPLLLSIVQFLGLILIVFSLLWVSKDKLLPHR